MDHSRRSAAKATEDDNRQKWRDGAFGQGGGSDEEIEIEEPELAVGLIPCIPAQHADAEGRGELHVGRCAARKADDSGAGGGDERGVKLASAAEAADVEIDERDQDEGEAGEGRRADQS